MQMRDGRDALSWMNKASLVALHECGMAGAGEAARAARAIARLDVQRGGGVASRSGDFKLAAGALDAIEPGTSRLLHAGRSRMDLGATGRRLLQRQRLGAAAGALHQAWRALLRCAAARPHALVPAYTQGRYSAPVSWGHYLAAHAGALQEYAGQLRLLHADINRSPLGASAGAGSLLPLDRARLAALLGFDAPIENTLHANDLATLTTGARIAGTAQSLALAVGALAADLGQQYAQAEPWIRLREHDGVLTSRSTSMPHKVNPSLLHRLRQMASELLSLAMSYLLKAHNTPLGHSDPKGEEPLRALEGMAALLRCLALLLRNLELDAARAQAEVDSDFAAASAMVEQLHLDCGVPFPIGHHFALALMERARASGWTPGGVPHAEAARLFAEVCARLGRPGLPFVPSAQAWSGSLSAAGMVARSAVTGGPQPAEVQRMLQAQRSALHEDRHWWALRRLRLRRDARHALDAFEALRSSAD